MLGKEVLYGIRKHFDCSSEVSFEECAFRIKGNSLRIKVVFVVICTGGKIIGAMGQQAGGCVPVPAMMQMPGMNVASIQHVTPAEPTEPVKEAVEKLPENNLELSDKPLDDGALASLSAMFGDDEED